MVKPNIAVRSAGFTQAAHGAMEEQLEGLREAGADMTATAEQLRNGPAAGNSEAQDRLARIQLGIEQNAMAQRNVELRLQALAQRLGSQAMRNTAALAGMRADEKREAGQPVEGSNTPADAPDGGADKQPAAPAEQQAQQQAQQQAEGVPPAALVLRGIFSLGLEPAQVQRVRWPRWRGLACVSVRVWRVCLFGGKQGVLVEACVHCAPPHRVAGSMQPADHKPRRAANPRPPPDPPCRSPSCRMA